MEPLNFPGYSSKGCASFSNNHPSSLLELKMNSFKIEPHEQFLVSRLEDSFFFILKKNLVFIYYYSHSHLRFKIYADTTIYKLKWQRPICDIKSLAGLHNVN